MLCKNTSFWIALYFKVNCPGAWKPSKVLIKATASFHFLQMMTKAHSISLLTLGVKIECYKTKTEVSIPLLLFCVSIRIKNIIDVPLFWSIWRRRHFFLSSMILSFTLVNARKNLSTMCLGGGRTSLSLLQSRVQLWVHFLT